MPQDYQPSGSQEQSTQYGTQPVGQRGSPQRYMPMGQQAGQQFQSSLPPEFRVALESFATVTETAEWCADRCMDHGPQMADCARACEDLADLAGLNQKLIARDSAFGPQVAEAYLSVARQAIPILQRNQQLPHVGETYSVVGQSLDSTSRLLGSIGYQSRLSTGQPMERPNQEPTQQNRTRPQGTQQQGTSESSQQSY